MPRLYPLTQRDVSDKEVKIRCLNRMEPDIQCPAEENMGKASTYSFVIVIFFVLTATACSNRQDALSQVERHEETKSALTPGMTKKEIIKGKTTQADVMQVFVSV